MDKKIGTIEMVTFRLKNNVSNDTGKAQLEKLTNLAAQHPGFVARHLSQDSETGEWLDLVYWKNLENARNAAQEIMKEPAAQEIFGLIEESSIQMKHWNVDHTSELSLSN